MSEAAAGGLPVVGAAAPLSSLQREPPAGGAAERGGAAEGRVAGCSVGRGRALQFILVGQLGRSPFPARAPRPDPSPTRLVPPSTPVRQEEGRGPSPWLQPGAVGPMVCKAWLGIGCVPAS